jgi:glycosyltransferase involved in cell wall biosynthesis
MDTMIVDFVKYNRDRLPQYRTETTVCSTPEGRWVVKRALSDEGRAHVHNIVDGTELLRRRLPSANVPRAVLTEEGVRLDYIEGTFLEDSLLQRVLSGDREGFIEIIRRFRTYLETLGVSDTSASVEGTVRELLSEVPDRALVNMMPVANLDLTLDNVIVDGDGRYWITDHEWVFDSPIPLSFVLYRSLYVLYLKHERRLTTVMSFPEALTEVGVEKGFWETYRNACESFIDLVLGKDRPGLVPSGYRKKTHHLASLAHLQSREGQLYATRLELEATRTALDEMIANAKLREGRLQEQELKLGEMTKNLEATRSSLAEKEAILETLQVELESEKLRHSATHTQLGLEKDHAYRLIEEVKEEKRQREQLAIELEGERVLSHQLEEELRLSREDLRIAREALAESQGSIAHLITVRDEEFLRLQEMTERFMAKQAELMTMSDWAHSMQLRLEFLESVPTIRFTENVARNQKRAVEKLRSEGIVPTVKDMVLGAAPQKLQQMFYRQEPSNIRELEEDARERDVLVVFPVIPWEFRWQRPQQLVSRFAEHGYTVVFVNMTLTPRGSRYLNNAEALKDVTLGRISDHVFEVHLSSLNKINVYQDRLKGGDLTNVGHGLLGVLRELTPSSVTYLVQFPGWGQLANLVRSRVSGTLIFDCMDDHAGFSNNAIEVVRKETKLMERADLVIASSEKLYEKAATFNDNPLLVRNGTDFEMFHDLSPNGKLDSMRRPIIGYHGAISEWFDPDIVARCAERHPEWSFVLIGSTLGCKVNGLKRMPNVHLLGEMPYQDLPGYLYYFDVCIIPFRVCELTLATNPVKFYEYLSSGKPVVTVKLPEMEQYADICYLYDWEEDFEKGIVSALAEDDEGLRSKRIEVARESSWNHRFQEIKDHLTRMEGEGQRKRKILKSSE